MPNPGSASPALSLAALGETVDLLGVVVARMSEKLDQHGETLAAVQKTALESRDAAQSAKAYADPQRYGRHIGNEIDKALAVPLDLVQRDGARSDDPGRDHADSAPCPAAARPGQAGDYRPQAALLLGQGVRRALPVTGCATHKFQI